MNVLNFQHNVFLIISIATTLSVVNSIEVIEIPGVPNNNSVDDVESTTDPTVLLDATEEPENKTEYKIVEREQNLRSLNVDEKLVVHPCRRPCDGIKRMVCRYDFVVQYYSVMGKGCYDCPYNKTHCNTKSCISADGVKRTIITVNQQMPGPTIEVCLGDQIEVLVTNKLRGTTTSIHWHGILQKENPFMDGVPFVAQCPIGPEAAFLYSFRADAQGTHLWHSHSATQRGDGIYGALIVKVPPSDNPHLKLYDYDLSEHVLLIMDWEHSFSVDKFTLHIHAEGDNKPPSLLVNGKGRYEKFGNETHILYTPLEKFTVRQGFRYRFRLINSGFLNCPIQMSVDNHNLTIIATDGENVEPIEAESLISLAGERFDFVLDANQEVKNYWIRFKGIQDCGPKQAHQVAILNYLGANEDQEPEGVVTYETAGRSGVQVNDVNVAINENNHSVVVAQLASVGKNEDPALKPEPDFKFYIPFDFYPIDYSLMHYELSYDYYKLSKQQRVPTPQMSHISMQLPSFPVMAEIEKSRGLHFCNGTSISMECLYKKCQCTHVLQVPLNAVVEVILIDEGKPFQANHPFHLHGYKFRVVGMNRLGDTITEAEVRRLDNEGLLKRNFINPPTKDTVTTPDGGYTILRFHATNPGFWLMHCHIDFHAEMGMALLFKVGDDSKYKKPPKDFPKCGDFGRSQGVEEYQAQFFPAETITDHREYYSIHASASGRRVEACYFSTLLLITTVILM
ncbi:hypothetical protein RUM43_002142 [Polyplax serrata]|uniref:Uncharacterized protein n=1 Tax=Polyplax serrata TaxID=468196 RepID=A0AAN8P1W8_POLSC